MFDRIRRILVTWLMCLPLAHAAVADAASPPAGSPPALAPSGRIVFDVIYGSSGFRIGEARHEWQYDGDRYRLSLKLDAGGLLALAGFSYMQRSEGRIGPAGLEPARFSVDQRGRKPEAAEFDWAAARVSLRRDGVERRSAELHPGDQDVLSLWHQLRRVGATGEAMRMTVVTNKSAKPAELTRIGGGSLKLPLGRLDTVQLQVRALDGSMTIDVWLAPEHQLLPVRIRIVDDDGGVLDQQAVKLELGADAVAAGGDLRKG